MDPLRRRQESGHVRDEPLLVLLWRQPVHEAVQLAGSRTRSRVVLVRLMNQALDETVRAACKRHDLSVVTLPLAFAGLHAGDQVLRDAVLQRLQEQRVSPVSIAPTAVAVPA